MPSSCQVASPLRLAGTSTSTSTSLEAQHSSSHVGGVCLICQGPSRLRPAQVPPSTQPPPLPQRCYHQTAAGQQHHASSCADGSGAAVRARTSGPSNSSSSALYGVRALLCWRQHSQQDKKEGRAPTSFFSPHCAATAALPRHYCCCRLPGQQCQADDSRGAAAHAPPVIWAPQPAQLPGGRLPRRLASLSRPGVRGDPIRSCQIRCYQIRHAVHRC